MSFTNSQLAQKISDLIGYWTTFLVEHKNWLGGEVGGGPGLDGKYPLTDWNGQTSLIDAPAQLADNVNNLVTGAQGYATAASASADAAAASASTATTQAGLSDTARIAAETARTQAQTAETGAVDAKVTAIAQANLATDRAGYAQEWANLGYQVPVSVAAGGDGSTTFSAKHWAQIAENFSGSIDSNLYAKLADNETITGTWTFTPRPVLSSGFEIPDTNGYIWNLTGFPTWGQYWNTTTNSVEFHSAGTSNITLDVDNGSIYALTDIQLGNQLGDRIGVYGTLDASTSYGIGIEASTMYYKSNSIHRWYVGQNADGGVAHKMALTGSVLDVNVNANFAAGVDIIGTTNFLSSSSVNLQGGSFYHYDAAIDDYLLSSFGTSSYNWTFKDTDEIWQITNMGQMNVVAGANRDLALMNNFAFIPKGYIKYNSVDFRFDASDTAWCLDRLAGATYSVTTGTDPGSTAIKALFGYTNSYINLNTYKDVSNNWTLEVTGFSLSNSSNSQWKPYVLFHSAGASAGNLLIQFLEGDGITWTTVYNGASRDVINPTSYTAFATGILKGMRFTFTGISGNTYLKMIGATSITSPSFQWQALRSGSEVYGTRSGKLNNVEGYTLTADGTLTLKTGTGVVSNSGHFYNNANTPAYYLRHNGTGIYSAVFQDSSRNLILRPDTLSSLYDLIFNVGTMAWEVDTAFTSQGKITGTYYEATATDPNTDPGTDDAYISGYGILGNRTNGVYVSNVGGPVKLNYAGVHGAGTKLETTSLGVTIYGASAVTGNGSFGGSVTVDGPAQAISVKGGVNDHVYIGWYADAAAQTTRSAYMGFGGAGTDVLTIANEQGPDINLIGNVNVSSGLDVTGNITVTGTVDGVDIAAGAANWNTAYGWGDHSVAGYATVASGTFNGAVTAGNDSNTRGEVLIYSDNLTSPINDDALAPGRIWLEGRGAYADWNIQPWQNFLYFYTDGNTISTPSFTLQSNGNAVFLGSVTASGGNSANWNTAFGWGNHAGLYEPVDASLVRSGTLSQEDNYTYLNRNNASNPVLHVAQVGAGPIAQFGKAPSLGSTGYTQSVTIGGDGSVAATGAVTGSNLNVANWDTAYGWGNHASAGYAPLLNPNFTDGIAMGSQVAATNIDLSKHLDLYGGTYGINVTASTMNFVRSGVREMWLTSGLLTVAGAITATGAVTGSNLNVANWDTAYGWGNHASAGYAAASHNHTGVYQPLDADLTAIAALAGTSGFLKKTAADTWSLDTTSYAPLASPALTGTATAENMTVTGGLSVGNADSTIARIGAGKLEIEGKPILVNASTSYNSAEVTFSTSAPSGGADGDIWFQYT